jgi:hypothetical protein
VASHPVLPTGWSSAFLKPDFDHARAHLTGRY